MNTSNFSANVLPTKSIARIAILRVCATALIFATAFGSAVAAEDSFNHKYIMRGQVLELEGNTLVVCVGKQDGAEVGQVLGVVRHVRVPGNSKKAGPRYRREDVGSVRISSLFDEHYANAKIVKGSPKVNDTVELDKQ